MFKFGEVHLLTSYSSAASCGAPHRLPKGVFRRVVLQGGNPHW